MLIGNVMTLLNDALEPLGGCYATVGPQASYPALVYGFVGQSQPNAVAPSFDADTETFILQLSVFDDEASGSDMLALLQDAAEAVAAIDGVVRVRYRGGTPPVYLGSEREWRVTGDYEITLAQ